MVVGRRTALSLVELLIVIAIVGALTGLTLSAVQKARASAQKISCGNNLRQIGIACVQYHDISGRLPSGQVSLSATAQHPFLSWQGQLLPYLDQDNLWRVTVDAYKYDRFAFDNPPHIGLSTPLAVLGCPGDGRLATPHSFRNLSVALTSYIGSAGTNAVLHDGLFWADSGVPYSGITDGLSNTMLVGERPPSADLRFGWWYAGAGQNGAGSLDSSLGAREVNRLHRTGRFGGPYAACPPGPYHFQPGNAADPCSAFHFWSFHDGGANFLFADGSVHFLTYAADAILPLLGSRGGGEVVDWP